MGAMAELQALSKMAHVQKGSRILVVPMSKHSGDRITATATPCTDEPEAPFEIREPFEAVFEDFDGEKLKVRTPRFYCLIVMIREIKDVRLLGQGTRGCI